MSFEKKYLKYKIKYLNLKNQINNSQLKGGEYTDKLKSILDDLDKESRKEEDDFLYTSFFKMEMLKNNCDEHIFPKFSYPVDSQKWINSHCTVAGKEYAEILIDLLDYVPFDEYYENLIKCIERFITDIQAGKDTSQIFVLGFDEQGKSNKWMVSLFVDYLFKQFRKGRIVPIPIRIGHTQFVTYEAKKYAIDNIVLVDDAQYSGIQFNDYTIDPLIQNLRRSKFNNVSWPLWDDIKFKTIKIHCLLPYSTNKAKYSLESHLKEYEAIKGQFKIYTEKIMKTLNEKLEDKYEDKAEAMRYKLKILYETNEGNKHRILYSEDQFNKPFIYFDTKMPDHWSQQAFLIIDSPIGRTPSKETFKQKGIDISEDANKWEQKIDHSDEDIKEYCEIMDQPNLLTEKIPFTTVPLDFDFRQYGRTVEEKDKYNCDQTKLVEDFERYESIFNKVANPPLRDDKTISNYKEKNSIS